MAYGDAIMVTARVKGLHAKGQLAGFGYKNEKRIKWTGYCESVFKYNPNIARPGQERQVSLWFNHYKKDFVHGYCRYDDRRSIYIWNYQFKAEPGEFHFAANEALGLPDKGPYIMIEPNVMWNRPCNVNKDWGDHKYERLAQALLDHGCNLVQCVHGNSRRIISGAHQVKTETFRDAVRVLAGAQFVICAEGANQHAAAALNIPAIVPWGAWNSPQMFGYDGQIYFTGGESVICGNLFPCPHCRAAFNRIRVDDVYQAAIKLWDMVTKSSVPA